MPAAGNLPPADILWLVAPAVTPYLRGANVEQALLRCEIASARLRMAVAASAWRSSGGSNRFVEVASDSAVQSGPLRRTGISVVPKFTGDLPVQLWLDALGAAKTTGQRLVIDVCDYPFRTDKGAVPAFYRAALSLADAVVVNSMRMAEQMTPHFGKPVTVIEDAVLGESAVPRFAPVPSERLNLLWFGHPSNLRFLEPWIRTLIEQGPKPCRLTVVTQDGYGVKEAAANLSAQLAPSFEMVFVEWSLQATRRELERCDLTLLPSDPADARKSGASANRLAEVLHAGRFVVASPLHSYLAFSEMAWVGENLLEGLQWSLANREAVMARIHKGQALVREKYAMNAIGLEWREFFAALTTK